MRVVAPADHRRDIDGLRAVAVMGVILDHAGVTLLRSGHAGVDVFFVISGFLLGGIIATDLRDGRFSFGAFYMRRARRILPALFAMVLVTLPFAWVLMTPDQLRYYGGGAFSTLMFLSNVWFFDQIDYFNPGAAESPLVHTWSLGVEEQFYIVLPLLMVALFRFGGRALFAVVLTLALASFVAAMATAAEHPSAAFYLIHARAWELLAGVLGALAARRGPATAWAGALVAAGLAMVVGGLVAIPETADWPGVWTLVPVTGTLLVLVFGSAGAWASRLLGLAPLVGVGLVSYSAYLWHQPILAFLRLVGRAPESFLGIAVLIAVTLVVAWASWALVEQPFRNRRVPRRVAGLACAAAMCAIAAFALGGVLTRGYPGRMPPEALAALGWGKSWSDRYWDCVGGRAEARRLDPAQACVHGAPAPARVAIWGDSHAATLAAALGAELAPRDIALRELSIGGCMPVTGVQNSGQNRSAYCSAHNARMIDYLIAQPTIEVVVVHAYWNFYTERRAFDNGAGRVRADDLFAYPPEAGPDVSDADRAAHLATRLRHDLGRLSSAGKTVILLYPLPEPGFDLPDWMARQVLAGASAPDALHIPAQAFRDYSRLSRSILDDVGALPGLVRLDLSSAICDREESCTLIDKGAPLFRDDNHLSLPGVARVVPPLAAEVARHFEPML